MAQSMARPGSRGGQDGPRWLVVGGGAIVVLGLTFALGIAVGRHWAPHRDAEPPAAEAARKPAVPVGRRSGLIDPTPERPPQEKLTFYQTLTAPMSDAPAPTAKVSAPAKPEPVKPEPAKPRPTTDRVSTDRPAATPASAPKPDKPAGTAVPGTGPARVGDWAVQVGVFRDREQAESVRRPLAGSGFDAYLIAVTAPDGQTQYKVRMGTFKSREDAARMAERVRQERSLAAFVTPK
jgi:DedD protein